MQASSGVSGPCGRLLGSQPSGPKRGIFCFHALGDNVFADSLNSRFIHDTSVAHSVEIRRRFIPFKSDFGTRDGAAMHHQINPLAAHIIILSPHRAGSELSADQRSVCLWLAHMAHGRLYCRPVSLHMSSFARASSISRQIVHRLKYQNALAWARVAQETQSD